MAPDDFLRNARLLTGTEVKGEDQIDRVSLAAILVDDTKRIDCSHLNELLLLVHKDRVETPFFEHFFGTGCTIGQIPEGVGRFQRTALLLYGNFVFAYRTLSRIKDVATFREKIAEASREPETELKYFQSRPQKLLEVDRIAQHQTPFVGYLSVSDIVADLRRCELLRGAAKEVGSVASWAEYLAQIQAMANPEQFGPLSEIVRNFREKNTGTTVSDFGGFLGGSFARLSEMKTEVQQIRTRATKNQNTYLTWDHMDVYFATSMRKAWEYQDLYGFIERLMASQELKELELRYFDPTQAYTDNRVNKGLVEALMLKRAGALYGLLGTGYRHARQGFGAGLDSCPRQARYRLHPGHPSGRQDKAARLRGPGHDSRTASVCAVRRRPTHATTDGPGVDSGRSRARPTHSLLREPNLAFYYGRRCRQQTPSDARRGSRGILQSRCQVRKGSLRQAGADPERNASACAAGESRNWSGKWRSGGADHSGLRGLASLHLVIRY